MELKEKGHGFIRKNKAGKVVTGIILGSTMFLAGQVASADEVKAPTDAKPVATATTETPKATNTEAPKQEVQAETKEAPKTEEVKDQAGLDKKYSELKEQAKKLDVEVKEGKAVTHDTVANASKDLDEQGKKVEELAKGRDEANAKLQKAISDAKAVGINVQLDEKVVYDNLAKGEEDIAKQVEELNSLTAKVKDAQARLSKAVEMAQQAGVKFEGVKTIDLKDGDIETFSKQVEEAEKALNAIVAQQKTVSAELNKAVADAKAKGVNVTVEGETVVDAKDAQKALTDAKSKIAKALADAEAKNKTIRANNAKVTEANKNAKAELVNGSTATKNADGTYTQTLAVKNEKAGSKWSGNLANTGSAEIVSVKLVAPSGKETVFANGKIDSSKALDEVGEYKLVYTFKAKDNTAGNISGKLNVEGQAGQTGKATGTVAFATKAPVNTKVTNEYKPTVLDVVLDFSSSYRYKIFDSIDQAKMLINEALTNKDSKVIIQAYTYNSDDTYAVKKNGTGSNGYSTTLLTKAEALKILDELKVLVGKNPSISDKYFPSNFEGYFDAIEKTFGDKNYVLKNADAVVPFEDVVKEVTKPTDLVSVIQFTDGWNGGEEVRGVTTPLETIDTSFAEWAKSRAKTFMSVVNKNVTKASDGDTDKDTNSEQSIKDMTRVGHPNIYDMTGKDRSVVDKELLAKFKETAIEKVTSTKGENQTVKVTVGGNGVTVTKATLKGATTKDLAVKDGKVDFSEKLADGNYTVEFEATGNGTVTAVVTIDGKEVAKKSAEIKSTAGSNGSSSAKEDKLQPSKLGATTNEVKPEAVKVAKITLKAQKSQVGKVEAKAHEVAVSSEVHPVNVAKKEVKRVLPNTGSTASVALAMAGVGMLSLAGASLKKKKD